MSGHPAFQSLWGFVIVFLLPLILCWSCAEIVTGCTGDAVKWIREKWRNRKR